jgi:hypothetical protein
MSREMVDENEEDFFFLTGAEAGFVRCSGDGGKGYQKLSFRKA